MGFTALNRAELASSWAPCSCWANSALNAATFWSASASAGRRSADLRDEFVKGGAVHCSPHAQSRLGDPENCIAEKVNQRLTLKTAKALGLEEPPTLLLVRTTR